MPVSLGRRSTSAGAVVLPAGFVVTWSSGYIGARLCGDATPVVTVMAWRFTVVALALGAVVWLLRRIAGPRDVPGARRPWFPAPREIGAHAVIGVLGQVV